MQTVVVGDALLVAIGRVPHVEGLGLEAAGVEYDTNQGVKVRMQTCLISVLVPSHIKADPLSTEHRDNSCNSHLHAGRDSCAAENQPWTCMCCIITSAREHTKFCAC